MCILARKHRAEMCYGAMEPRSTSFSQFSTIPRFHAFLDRPNRVPALRPVGQVSAVPCRAGWGEQGSGWPVPPPLQDLRCTSVASRTWSRVYLFRVILSRVTLDTLCAVSLDLLVCSCSLVGCQIVSTATEFLTTEFRSEFLRSKQRTSRSWDPWIVLQWRAQDFRKCCEMLCPGIGLADSPCCLVSPSNLSAVDP